MASPGSALSPCLFISYNWRDRAQVQTCDQHLTQESLKVFIDYRRLTPGRPWITELEQAIRDSSAVATFYGPHGFGPTQTLEIQFGVALRKQVIPVILPGVREDPPLSFLTLNTCVDLRRDPLARLAAAVRREPLSPAPAPAACPYKGLAFFREEDAAFYFGREHKTKELATQLLRYKFVAVTGPSGNGKSSLLRAGLAHALRSNKDEPWEILSMAPNQEPFLELGRALGPVLYPDRDPVERARAIAGNLAAARVPLRDYARELEERNGGGPVLLIVDQFEELYTLAGPSGQVAPFLDQILDTASRLHIVVAYRGDFHDRVTSHYALAERLRESQFILGPMLPEGLREAIERPAAALGRPLDAALVERLVEDVGAEPGNLPLLEFVLRQLWESPELSLDAYHSLGGLRGALASHADGVFRKRLTPLEQEAARRVFLRVVRPAESGPDTRRRVSRAEIGALDWSVVEKLAGHPCRLLVTGREAGEETAEVCHEALIRAWPELKRWLDEEREFLLWRDRLRTHLDEYTKAPGEDALLRGVQLGEAQRWSGSALLSEQERAYIGRSAEAALAQAEREKQAARQLSEALEIAQREGAAAEAARSKAQTLVDYLISDLRDHIAPYVPTAIREEINRRVSDYQNTIGYAGNASRERSRGVQLKNEGDAWLARGNLAAALESYQASHAIRQQLSERDPANTQWQRDLSLSHEKFGDVQARQGNLAAALAAYQASLAIRQQLSERDPASTEWQRDLSISHMRTGDVQTRQGNVAGALASYNASHAIRQQLSKRDPANTEWQRDLSVSHNKVGEVQARQGNLAATLASYQSGLAIAQQLSQRDPANTQWQRDLSVSQNKIGDMQASQGNLTAALASYQASLAVRQQLSQRDPAKTQWQRDLSVSHNKIGDVRARQGNLAAALAAYRASLAIRQQLSQRDPANTEWQRDLSVSHEKIGEMQARQGNLAAALAAYQASLAIRQQLSQCDPANTEWQRNLVVSGVRIASAHLELGNPAAARPHAETALKIAERLVLLDPTNAQWRDDLRFAQQLTARLR